MPELPEVEIFRKEIDAAALHHTITGVEVLVEKVVEVPSDEFIEALKGQKIKATDRLGKYLLVELASGNFLVIHFGMTGYLVYANPKEELPPYACVVLKLDQGINVVYVCSRKLGRLGLATNLAAFKQKKGLSEDALKLSREKFHAILSKRKAPVKSVIMDQGVAAGVGNWVADEILFQSQIHPKTRAHELSGEQVIAIYEQMQQILQFSIDMDVLHHDLPEGYLNHERKAGAKCPRCGGPIEKTEVGGRGSYFCPHCQQF